MIDIKLIIEKPDYVKNALLKKGYEVDFQELISWDADKRALLHEIEQLKAQRNKVSAEIPKLKKQGLPVENIFQEMREIGDKITEGDAKINDLTEKITGKKVVALPIEATAIGNLRIQMKRK